MKTLKVICLLAILVLFPVFSHAEDINVCKKTYANGVTDYMFPPLLLKGKCPNGYSLVPLTGGTQSLKPPAAFSADGEFIGYVIGSGNRTNHIEIYNDKINYRFMVGNGDGVIGYYWPGDPPWGGAYSVDSSCSETYLYKNRLQDVVIGKNDFGNTWTFNTELVTTDSSQTIDASTLKYKKVWEPLTNNSEIVYYGLHDGEIADCSIVQSSAGFGVDYFGNPLYKKPNEPNKCYGIAPVPVHDSNGNAVMGLNCSYQPVNTLTGTYHKVVPFTMTLPFKHPIAVPIEIRVEY